MRITKVKVRPKMRTWEITVDGRNYVSEEEMFSRLRSMARSDIYYMKTNFGGMNTTAKFYPRRQRNFTDGYFVYTLWFTTSNDATVAKMFT